MKARQQWPDQDRLYPTEKEERRYRELKKRYGLQDAMVVESQADNPNDVRQTQLERELGSAS